MIDTTDQVTGETFRQAIAVVDAEVEVTQYEADAKDAARLRELLSELITVWINGRKIHDGMPLPLRERIDTSLAEQEKR